jgi:chromosome segregation ATPase
LRRNTEIYKSVFTEIDLEVKWEYPRQLELTGIPETKIQILTTIMTQSNDQPNDRRIDRQLRTIARRVNRLEDTQVTWGELNVEFDRLYDEVAEVRADLKADISDLKGDIASLNGKIDVLLQHITGGN